jgi:hypothetical protein
MLIVPRVTPVLGLVGPATLKAAGAAGLVTVPPPPDIVYWYVTLSEFPEVTQ